MKVSLPVHGQAPIETDTPSGEPARRPPRYGRWRAATLIGVHLLFVAHIVHWKLAGTTLAPLELNEVMHTLEIGIVTAGFVLMSIACLSVLVFGRFFCSWGCHILALQDLCGWLLARVGIRPKPVRSRLLLLVPPAALFYMFIWPQVRRLAEGRPAPALHLRVDGEGWASFVTNDFWRNLPGPTITLITFAICGFAIVYVLGSRSFCTYVCPYGAAFSLADRITPGRIRLKSDGNCTGCAKCTAVCESHVRVHEEIQKHGRVVDPACLKDLDCVASCPEQAITFGFARPAMLQSFTGAGRRRLRYDFSLSEELLMAAVFMASLLALRGLYGLVPFLLSLGLAAILAYFAILLLRLVTKANVRLNAFQFKFKGQVTRIGRGLAVAGVMTAVFVTHCGWIRYNEFAGQRNLEQAETAFEAGDNDDAVAAASMARRHLETSEEWGLLTHPQYEVRLASACWVEGDGLAAEAAWRRAAARAPDDLQSRLFLAASLVNRGRADLATPILLDLTTMQERSAKDAARYAHDRATAWQRLASLAVARGDYESAADAFSAAARERPDWAAPRLALASLHTMSGDLESAATELAVAITLAPGNAEVHYYLGELLRQLGREEEGRTHLRRAAELDPRFSDAPTP